MPIVFLIAQILGVVSSIDSLFRTRTSQGAIAWIVALNTISIVAVPAYWIFGRTKFRGYRIMRQRLDAAAAPAVQAVRSKLAPFVFDTQLSRAATAATNLAKLRFLKGNDIELLVDGARTFPSIFDGIDRAERYVLVQFYIVHDDGIGRALKERLITAARRGVKIWFLFDEIGSHDLPDSYVTELRAAGIAMRSFHTTRGARNRFQLNFRNHRKIVVVDGRHGWVGGLNIGDEYDGKSTKLPNWRDTHIRISGPSAIELQISFAEDWRWATDEELDLSWDPVAAPGATGAVLIVPTGPADRLETASLMYQQAIHAAERRIWIASPYFVPDQGVTASLHLAALGGVDVRVLIPDKPDHRQVWFSAFALAGDLISSGVAIHRYQAGFLHEKVFLVDDTLAGVGTANLDNRSFRLNFEVTALVSEPRLIADVEAMFQRDFARSRVMTVEEIAQRPWWFKAIARACHLLAPIQ
jgi:cardiolipin synthase A/B